MINDDELIKWINENEKLIWGIINECKKKVKLRGNDYDDDLYAEALYHITLNSKKDLKDIEEFKSYNITRLKSFLVLYILRNIYKHETFYERMTDIKYIEKIEKERGYDDHELLKYRKALDELIDESKKILTKREYEIFDYVINAGLTINEIANVLGVTRQSVNQTYVKALKKINDKYTIDYFV